MSTLRPQPVFGIGGFGSPQNPRLFDTFALICWTMICFFARGNPSLVLIREDKFLNSFMFADYLLHWTGRAFSKMRVRWAVGKQSRSGRRLFPNAPVTQAERKKRSLVAESDLEGGCVCDHAIQCESVIMSDKLDPPVLL